MTKITREKIILDATDVPMGRLASKIAMILMGKTKTGYFPHIDGGDYVIVENISKIKLTGKKLETKYYHSHSGYTGNLKSTQLKSLMPEKADWVLKKAVTNMLPKNKLQAEMLKRLTINK